ncbi:MAG: hypothetical protein V1834_01140, partial [Candidatus Micrarchaeota archaeon]
SPALSFKDSVVPGFEWLNALLAFLVVVFAWTYTLNLILAIVNLLPMFITDGHRVIFDEVNARYGVRAANAVFLFAGGVTLFLLLLNALPWFVS